MYRTIPLEKGTQTWNFTKRLICYLTYKMWSLMADGKVPLNQIAFHIPILWMCNFYYFRISRYFFISLSKNWEKELTSWRLCEKYAWKKSKPDFFPSSKQSRNKEKSQIPVWRQAKISTFFLLHCILLFYIFMGPFLPTVTKLEQVL